MYVNTVWLGLNLGEYVYTLITQSYDHCTCSYYLADEPGGNGVDPALLEKAYDFVKVACGIHTERETACADFIASRDWILTNLSQKCSVVSIQQNILALT